MYATVEQANAYHNARLTREQWQAIADEEKQRALRTASDLMEVYAMQKGRGFKRDYTKDTPEKLMQACCLLACKLKDDSTQARLKAQRDGVSSVSIGGASESYNAHGIQDFIEFTAEIKALIKPFIKHFGDGWRII